jgi:hypothetical protein
VKALVPTFEFAIVEECFQYRECGKAALFIDAGEAVLEVEYKLGPWAFLPEGPGPRLQPMKKRLSGTLAPGLLVSRVARSPR